MKAKKYLSDTNVYRGGWSSELKKETSTCEFVALGPGFNHCIQFRFDMASKGGGTTRVKLTIGKGDFSTLLEGIAEAMSEDCSKVIAKVGR